jgi:hypothetical protein
VVLVVTNDLIWWAPFALYLYDARPWRMAVRQMRATRRGRTGGEPVPLSPGQ